MAGAVVLAALGATGRLQGKAVVVDRTGVTDDGVAAVGRLTGLEELTLAGDRVTDSGLKHLRGLRDLRVEGVAEGVGPPHHRARGLGLVEELEERHPENVAIDDRHPHEPPVVRLPRDHGVERVAVLECTGDDRVTRALDSFEHQRARFLHLPGREVAKVVPDGVVSMPRP